MLTAWLAPECKWSNKVSLPLVGWTAHMVLQWSALPLPPNQSGAAIGTLGTLFITGLVPVIWLRAKSKAQRNEQADAAK